MALNTITGESKARAVKVALQERKQRLVVRRVRHDRIEALRRFLEEEVWLLVPRNVLGKRVTRREWGNPRVRIGGALTTVARYCQSDDDHRTDPTQGAPNA